MKITSKFTFVALILVLIINFTEGKPKSISKKGIVSKVKDAAAYGFGWQLGKEAAKATIQKGKEIVKDPKTKEKVKEIKEEDANVNTKLKK